MPTRVTRPPRSASRRSRPPTTSSATRIAARSTTRSAGSARPRPASPGWRRRARRLLRSDGGDLGDLLGGLFGRGGRRGGGGRGGRGPHRGQDLETELHLAFDDAVPGVTTAVHLTSEAPCRTCHGSGAKPGTARNLRQLRRPGRASPTTRACSRSPRRARRAAVGASSIDDPCPTCRGTGVERRPPRGEGAHPRRRRRRAAHPAQGPGRSRPQRRPARRPLRRRPRGSPSAVQRRKGNDLTLTVPITFAEAALGADITVPTLDGGPVTLRIPPGTRSGRTFRVKGRGVATPKAHRGSARHRRGGGPAKLSDAERKAVEALPSGVQRRVAPRAPGGVMADEAATTDAVYVISVAAELAGLHPQTLRIYERKGLVDPARTGGGSRRYSDEDIAQLRRIQELTSEGLNLAGVQRVLELEAELAAARPSPEGGPRAVPRRPSSRPTASTAASSSRSANPSCAFVSVEPATADSGPFGPCRRCVFVGTLTTPPPGRITRADEGVVNDRSGARPSETAVCSGMQRRAATTVVVAAWTMRSGRRRDRPHAVGGWPTLTPSACSILGVRSSGPGGHNNRAAGGSGGSTPVDEMALGGSGRTARSRLRGHPHRRLAGSRGKTTLVDARARYVSR